MANNWTPKGYTAVTPYLHVSQADQLITFLHDRTTDKTGSIVHSEIRIGDGVLEILDAGEKWPSMPGALHVFERDTVIAMSVQ